ncbi:MAG: hypothetical protein ACE14V_08320 [bacterium]
MKKPALCILILSFMFVTFSVADQTKTDKLQFKDLLIIVSHNIDQVRTNDGEKYAPTFLAEAQASYYAAITAYQANDFTQVKKLYDEITTKINRANDQLRLRASDEIQKAELAIKEARDAQAPVYAGEILATAIAFKNIAEQKLEHKQYRDAIVTAQAVIEKALKAKTEAINRNPAKKLSESVNKGNDFAPNVFVVVIDGARYSETFGDNSSNVNHALIPHIWNDLRPLGSINTSFYNRGITVTVPGHTSIASGVWQHVTNDGAQRPAQPTFFEYYRQQMGIDSTLTWVIAGKTKLNVCSYSTTSAFGAVYGAMTAAKNANNDQVWDMLTTVMDTYHPRLVLINLPETDAAGHAGNWSRYTSVIYNADKLIYNLWTKITADTFYRNKTDLIVTNDHGRHDDAHGGFRNHGDDCDGCRHLMFLAIGPDFKSNYISPNQRTQIDICPTIGKLLGFKPTEVIGTSMDELVLQAMPDSQRENPERVKPSRAPLKRHIDGK